MTLSRLRDLARRAGLGRALRATYHTPVGLIRKSIQEGGPLEQRRTAASHREMTVAARSLPAVEVAAGVTDVELHILTGARFWDQTLFFVASVQSVSPSVRMVPVLYDDGTLTATNIDAVRRVLPSTRAERYPDIEARLNEHLPADRYPVLRARRLVYPHLRKLTDIHVGRTGWKLVADSDMLVFREPSLVLDWLRAPDRPLHMIDAEPAYGYSNTLIERLVGVPVPPLVNVGFFGFQSDAIDWDELERWASTLQEREGEHYFQEQALSAMLAARHECIAAPSDDYVVRPSLEEGRRPTAVLHHYVAESKRSYFQHGWRIVASGIGIKE